jgi:Zn-dependent protease with chaperone function
MTPRPITEGIAAPSMWGRAITVLALLAGFYALTLGVAAGLVSLPVLYAYTAKTFNVRVVIYLIAFCIIPAGMLVASVFRVRRPRCRPDGRRLERYEAPELFAILDDLAARAATAPPTKVYLVTEPALGVTEMDGERLLVIGVPYLAWSTVDELRAGLAHELGHFAFGDTRLLKLTLWAHDAFRSVLEGTSASRFGGVNGTLDLALGFAAGLGESLVKAYARVFFFVTRRADRRAELAADQLSARLVGPGPAIRLLEKSGVMGPSFDAYTMQIAGTVKHGVMPSDVLAGFEAFVRTSEERGILKRLAEEQRLRPTDVYDAHPAVPVRVAALASVPAPLRVEDARIALGLLQFDAQAWTASMLAHELRHLVSFGKTLEQARWSEVPQRVLMPLCAEEARKVAARLFPHYPEARTQAEMFAAVVRGLGSGHQVPPDAVATLFRGALLERGAIAEPSLGEPTIVFRYEGTRVLAWDLALRAFENEQARVALEQWASHLAAPASPYLASFSSTIMSAMR